MLQILRMWNPSITEQVSSPDCLEEPDYPGISQLKQGSGILIWEKYKMSQKSIILHPHSTIFQLKSLMEKRLRIVRRGCWCLEKWGRPSVWTLLIRIQMKLSKSDVVITAQNLDIMKFPPAPPLALREKYEIIKTVQ